MRYPCPCCGHLVFVEPPGSYDICNVCFWEDDNIQLRWPDYEGGANGPSLIESQQNFAAQGAMEQRFLGLVRPPAEDEPREPGWRPIDIATDSFELRGHKDALARRPHFSVLVARRVLATEEVTASCPAEARPPLSHQSRSDHGTDKRQILQFTKSFVVEMTSRSRG